MINDRTESAKTRLRSQSGRGSHPNHCVKTTMDLVRSRYEYVATLAEFLENAGKRVADPRLHRFAATTFVCGPSEALRAEPAVTCTNMDEVIDFVLQALVSRGIHNVLSSGFRSRRATDSGMGNAGIECFIPNTLLNLFKTPDWELLLLSVGASTVCSVLLGFSVFVKSRKCLLQIAGAPMYELRQLASGSRRSPHQSIHRQGFERWRMFYYDSFSKSPALPAKHVLHRLSRSTTEIGAQARCLLRHVFLYRRDVCLGRHVTQAEPIFAQLISRYRQCKMGRYLERRCPLRGQPPPPTQRAVAGVSTSESVVMGWHAYEDGYASQDDDHAAPLSATPEPCQLPESRARSRPGLLSSHTMVELLKMHSSTTSVVAFLHDVVAFVFPRELWGSRHNEAIIFQKLGQFLRLRRHETMCAAEVAQHLRTGDVAWLQVGVGASEGETGNDRGDKKRKHRSPGDHGVQKHFLTQLVHWLFTDFVIPLVRCCFYATERESKSTVISYFRKPVWASIRRLASQDSLPQFEAVSGSAREQTHSRLAAAALGATTVRLLPKATSVRAIANLSKRRRLGDGSFAPSTNSLLTPLYHVLKYECGQHPRSLGATVMGMDDIYTRLRSFKLQMDRSEPGHGTVFIASVDLKACFDNIDQGQLFALAQGLLTSDQYVIQRSSVVRPLAAANRVHVRHVRTVSPPGQSRECWLRAQALARVHARAVIVEGSSGSVARRDALVELLREHLFGHTVQLSARGTRFFRQARGIAQGSILSALLCNVFYGHLEASLLPDMVPPTAAGAVGNVLLLRLMDDFLCVSTDEANVRRFLDVMHGADRKGLLTLNRAKTRTNLPRWEEGGAAARGASRAAVGAAVAGAGASAGAGAGVGAIAGGGGGGAATAPETLVSGAWFPWCGVELSARDLSVRPSAQKLRLGSPFDLLTVDAFAAPGRSLAAKLCAYLAPKCHPVLFDAVVNPDPGAVYRNVLELSLFAAVKGCAHLRSIMRGPTVNCPFIVHAFCNAAVYLCRLLRRQARKQNLRAAAAAATEATVGTGASSRRRHHSGAALLAEPCDCRIRPDFVVWLALRAYLTVLERRPHRGLEPVLRALRSEVSAGRFDEARRQLPAFSAHFLASVLRGICC